LAGGGNLYAYASGSPSTRTDPLGLFVPFLVPLIPAAVTAATAAAEATVFVLTAVIAGVAAAEIVDSYGTTTATAPPVPTQSHMGDKKRKENIRDTGLEEMTTKAIKDAIPNAEGAEKRRLQKELKARGEKRSRHKDHTKPKGAAEEPDSGSGGSCEGGSQ